MVGAPAAQAGEEFERGPVGAHGHDLRGVEGLREEEPTFSRRPRPGAASRDERGQGRGGGAADERSAAMVAE